jgi:1-acyl-sn-glycerol-3-phosphate acyltransferase
MQFFEFIFLARSWAADRDMLTSRLSDIAAHHTVRHNQFQDTIQIAYTRRQTTTSARPEDDEPLNFIIFPEGNLVSADTAPISRKYADKMDLVSYMFKPNRPFKYCFIRFIQDIHSCPGQLGFIQHF